MPAVILPLYLPIFTYPLPLTHTHTELMLAFISPVPSISACIMFPFSCQRVASVPYFTAWSMYRTTHFSGKKFIWGTELFQIPPVGVNLSIILCEKQNLVCFCTVLRRVFSNQFNNIILNLHLSLLLHSFFCTPAAAVQSSVIICVLLGFRKRLLVSLTDLKYLHIHMLCLKSLEIRIHKLKIYRGSNRANAQTVLCSAYISQLPM